MINVRYVGKKSVKSDNVANTGTIWVGFGDVQPVSDAVWGKLSKHPDIWENADKPAAAETEQEQEKTAASTVISHNGETIDLASLSKETLKSLAISMGVEFHPNSGAEKIRAAIVEFKNKPAD